jgi:hypothetical protein
MFDPQSFRAASERLRLTVNTVAMIADGSHIGSPSDAFALLSSLHNDEERCHTVICPLLTKLAAISDWPPVQWSHGRGLSGLVRPCAKGAAFPHVWSSAHEAALDILRLSVRYFFWPLDGITDPDEQRSVFKRLLSKRRRKALAMTIEEVAELQNRIRREQAKLLQEIAPATCDLDEGVYPDGPFPPDSFYWQGKVYKKLTRMPFSALDALWQARGRTLSDEQLGEPVLLGDHADKPDETAMSNLRKNINTFFRKKHIPLHVEGNRNRNTCYLSLREGPPR